MAMGEDWEQDVLEEARQTIIRSRGQIKFPIRIGTVFARSRNQLSVRSGAALA
jgi:hypothetical protein